MENQQKPTVNASAYAAEVKTFFTTEFKALFRVLFGAPDKGLEAFFEQLPQKFMLYAGILSVATTLVYALVALALAGDMRDYLSAADYLRIASIPLFTMLFIALFTYGAKAIAGRGDFRRELFTGALCGIPLSLLIPGLLVVKILSPGNVLAMIMNPGSGGVLGIVLTIYVFLFLISIVGQSLRSSGISATLAWYISPLGIGLAFFLSSKLSVAIF